MRSAASDYDFHLRVALVVWSALIVLLGVALVFTFRIWGVAAATIFCSNDSEWRLPSPDGTKVAVRFERDCGAFGDPATNVSILQPGNVLLNQAGNAYFAVDQGGPIEPWGGPSLGMHWDGNQRLVLTHDMSDITWFAENPIDGVNIVVRTQVPGYRVQKFPH